MAETFGSFARRLDVLNRELLSDAAKKRIATRLGVAAKADARQAASADLGGDPKFSGWAPELATEFTHLEPGVIELAPTKPARGPFRVAQEGRNQGRTGPVQGPLAPRFNKNGSLSKRQPRRTRWNGQTQGKGTWDDAVKIIEKETPGRAQAETIKAIQKAMRG